MNQHQPRHINRVFVVRNHHRQKIGVGLTGVVGAVHGLLHAGHAGVNVGLKAGLLRVTARRRVCTGAWRSPTQSPFGPAMPPAASRLRLWWSMAGG